MATTQPVARRRKQASETVQRWLLVVASVTAVGVWATFGVLYYKRHTAPTTTRADLAAAEQDSVSVVISPPVAAPKPAPADAGQPSGGAAATKTGAHPLSAAPPQARPSAPPDPPANVVKGGIDASAKATSPAGRARVEEPTKAAGGAAKGKAAGRLHPPGDHAPPKKRPIDEGF